MQRSDRVDKQNAGVRPKASASCRTDRLFHQLQKQLAPSLCETRLEIDAQPAVVRADEVLVNCLLRNLIGNAKKAAHRDRTVRVKGVQKGNRYCVTVPDRGCGIPEEEIERITEPFYMVNKSRSRAGGGSGLGLAICQKIAELHHTQLKFQSQVGEGTTVCFYLEVEEDA
ncbi:MAG: ATP-binding protein [Massilioclostridium sp.]|nr:ATP-binding protein [Massilioclostridium sp.]